MAFKVLIVLIIGAAISTVCGAENYRTEIQIPKGCEDKLYCDIKPDDYPQELFDDYFRKKDKLLIRNKRYAEEPRERIYDTDPNNCHTRVSIKQLYTVRYNGTTKLVVQSSNFFEQWIKTTECLNTGDSCFNILTDPIHKYSCTQTDGSIKLYLYDPMTQRFEHEPVPFPACCSCGIIR